MKYILVISFSGVNEMASLHDDQDDILERLNRWLPELREGRVQLQDFGYKRAVVSENGTRVYEIFEVGSATEVEEQSASVMAPDVLSRMHADCSGHECVVKRPDECPWYVEEDEAS